MIVYNADDIVKYADNLAKKNSEALSFIPRPRILEYAQKNQIIIEQENDELCGFLIHGTGKRDNTVKIYQACIQYDARRREHGLLLVQKLIDKATAMGAEYISLWCADDLEANDFWASAGFNFGGTREGGKSRKRKHNKWLMHLGLPNNTIAIIETKND